MKNKRPTNFLIILSSILLLFSCDREVNSNIYGAWLSRTSEDGEFAVDYEVLSINKDTIYSYTDYRRYDKNFHQGINIVKYLFKNKNDSIFLFALNNNQIIDTLNYKLKVDNDSLILEKKNLQIIYKKTDLNNRVSYLLSFINSKIDLKLSEKKIPLKEKRPFMFNVYLDYDLNNNLRYVITGENWITNEKLIFNSSIDSLNKFILFKRSLRNDIKEGAKGVPELKTKIPYFHIYFYVDKNMPTEYVDSVYTLLMEDRYIITYKVYKNRIFPNYDNYFEFNQLTMEKD